MIFKKVFKTYKPIMVRPTIYLCITKWTTSLALIMFWNRFFNTSFAYDLIADGFFIVGMFFLLGVWYQYLNIDDFRIISGKRDDKPKKKRRFWQTDIIDFVDEKVYSLDELEEDEQKAVRFTSNLVCCLLYIVPALIAMLFVY